jgi:hypothetical protein
MLEACKSKAQKDQKPKPRKKPGGGLLKAPSGNKDMLPAKEGHACFLQ